MKKIKKETSHKIFNDYNNEYSDWFSDDYDYIYWQENYYHENNHDYWYDSYLNDTNRIRQEKIDELLGIGKPTLGDILPNTLK